MPSKVFCIADGVCVMAVVYQVSIHSLIQVLVVSCVWGMASVAFAQNKGVSQEITALLEKLESSQCEFNRNGSWYGASKARSHLERKLAYIEARGELKSTEQFIELAATQSSFTGQAYQVRCHATQAVPSQEWLMSQLKEIRGR